VGFYIVRGNVDWGLALFMGMLTGVLHCSWECLLGFCIVRGNVDWGFTLFVGMFTGVLHCSWEC